MRFAAFWKATISYNMYFTIKEQREIFCKFLRVCFDWISVKIHSFWVVKREIYELHLKFQNQFRRNIVGRHHTSVCTLQLYLKLTHTSEKHFISKNLSSMNFLERKYIFTVWEERENSCMILLFKCIDKCLIQKRMFFVNTEHNLEWWTSQTGSETKILFFYQ